MFKDLRPNTPFYVLEKGEKIMLKVGTVESVSQPILKPQANFSGIPQYNNPEYIVNIKVKVGEETINFDQLPANMQIVDIPNGNQKLVVTPNREMIKTEIETTLANSKNIVENISKHENIITECENILQQINPSFAKEKEQEEEIKRLREQVSSMEKKLGSLDEIKDMLLSQSKNNTNSNNNKKQ